MTMNYTSPSHHGRGSERALPSESLRMAEEQLSRLGIRRFRLQTALQHQWPKVNLGHSQPQHAEVATRSAEAASTQPSIEAAQARVAAAHNLELADQAVAAPAAPETSLPPQELPASGMIAIDNGATQARLDELRKYIEEL